MRTFRGDSGQSHRLTDVNSFLISMAFHLAALVLLGVVSLYAGHNAPGDGLWVELADNSEVPSIEAGLPDGGGESDTAAGAAAAFAPPETPIEAQPVQTAAFVASDPQIDASGLRSYAFGDAAAAEAVDNSLALKSGRGGNGDGLWGGGSGAGTGKGDGHAQKGKAATDFFGVSGYGEVFVYVVDCSGSMSEDGKFERARYELLHSIEQLNSDQRYFVIFYNHRTFPMHADAPVAATNEQFEKTRRWIDYCVPDGRTVPLPALLQALSLKPDAIYFLSDGLFDPTTVLELRNRNRVKTRRIPIHTIAFVNHEAEGLMRMIAQNSGGEFRFVQ